MCVYVNYIFILQNTVGGENKRWIMVVDTNCLLNKESRKALQLLKGLKGTQLIIPRIGNVPFIGTNFSNELEFVLGLLD